MLSAECRQKNCHLILRICMVERTKCFLGIICCLSSYVVLDFKDYFFVCNVECTL